MITLFLAGSFIFQSCTEDESAVREMEQTVQNVQPIDLEYAEDLEEFETDEIQGRSISNFTFNTLNEALRCTGLNAALFSGQKTLYAPSDRAFSKLGITAENVCDALDVETLTQILLYHVAEGIVPVFQQGCLDMLNGDITQRTRRGFRLQINESTIYLAFNLRGSGYKLRVYAITDVLEVPALNIVETASGADQFASLVAAVLAADPSIAAALTNEDAIYTVFAPTNEAFSDLLSALGLPSLEAAVGVIGVDGLTNILLYHVVDACAFSNDLRNNQQLTTLLGETITVDLKNLAIEDKTETPAPLDAEGLDILTSNGIVHTIDKVLLPQVIIDAL